MSQIKLPDEIITQLKRLGCVQNGNSWTVDNIRFEFEGDLHISCYVNNIFRQGFSGAERIYRMLKEHADMQ